MCAGGRRRSGRNTHARTRGASVALYATDRHTGVGTERCSCRDVWRWYDDGLGATPGRAAPQFIDPSTGQVNPQIVSETHDALGTHVTYKDGAKVMDGTQVSALPKPVDGKTGAASDDFRAFVANHDQPVVVPLGQMVQSTSGIVTEVGPWVTEPGCVAPPANFNIATATDAQLALYGFPAVGTMPRRIYDTKFAWMKHRDCQTRGTNGPPEGGLSASKASRGSVALAPRRPMGNPTVRVETGSWTGNVADEYECGAYKPNNGFACPVGTPNTYTEADSDYYVPQLYNPGNCWPTCVSSYWVGLGGTGSNTQLVQAGVEGDYTLGSYNIYPWIEYQGSPYAENPQSVNVPGIGMGTHVYTRITYPGTYEIGNIDTQQFYTWSDNVSATRDSAEFIVEKNNNGDGLEKFSTFYFYGVGVTTQNGYYAMNNVPHDYTVAYWQNNGVNQLTNIGSINNDPGDYPYDEYAITWLMSCPGTCY